MEGTRAQTALSSGTVSGSGGLGPIYWSKAHKLAIDRLRFAVTSQAPLTVFIGQIGTGRTRLIRELTKRKFSDVAIGTQYNPDAFSGEVYADVLSVFDPKHKPSGDIETERQKLSTLLDRFHGKKRFPVLIVDDADMLPNQYLGALCALCDQSAGMRPMLKLVLVGQPGLTDVLAYERPDLTGPAFTLSGMSEEDVAGYLEARCSNLGADSSIFAEDAVTEVAAQTDGIPSRINALCDRVRQFAAKEGLVALNREHIRRVVALTRIFGTGRFTSSTPAPQNDEEQATEAEAALEIGQAEPPVSDAPDSPQAAPEMDELKTEDAPQPAKRSGRRKTVLAGAVVLAGVAAVALLPETGTPVGDRLLPLRQDAIAASQQLWAGLSDGGPGEVIADFSSDDITAAQARMTRISNALTDTELSASGQYRAALDLADSTADAAVVGFARAALSGHDRSAYYLGQIYETGEGVSVDLELARAWYKAAGPEVSGAVSRLNDMQPAVEGGTPSSPIQLFSHEMPGGTVELVWTSGDGSDPSFYRIELATADGDITLSVQPIAISAIRLTAPEDAQQWRVVAVDESSGTQVASPWVAIGPT